LVVSSRAFGANDKIAMGFVGVGSRGHGDMGGFLGSGRVQAVAVCDVFDPYLARAKTSVDKRQGNADCVAAVDFREVTRRDDTDAVFCGTPDHWHAPITIDAMTHGKDVFCEKPESLTIRESKLMTSTARRYGRVFSGGSQRVWGDYNWYHRMVRGGAIGEVREAWVNVGGPSRYCELPAEPVPEGLHWDMWLGPAPWRPFNKRIHPYTWRSFRDYSGGGMTDWGAHTFGGALFSMNLHKTGPVEVLPPDGKDVKRLTFVFANGVRMYHGGARGRMSFKGTEGECPAPGQNTRRTATPNIHIPNYKGRGGLIGDFLHCMETRERPFRDIEIAHRTLTVCHLGNIAYWLQRPLKWDPEKEEIVGDPEAARWIDRPRREPWRI
jgi:predicted dehydrogenase